MVCCSSPSFPIVTSSQIKNLFLFVSCIKSPTLFDEVGGNGDPRIDFLCNSKTRELFLCEVNPLPGSFAYYLWEASDPAVSYTELLTALLDEAENKFARKRQSIVLTESKIF